MPIIYGSNPRMLDRAKRSSQPVSQIGKQPPAGYRVTAQSKGVQDTGQWVDRALQERMRRDQPDPLTGKPVVTGPAHLKARLAARPDKDGGLGPTGSIPGEG